MSDAIGKFRYVPGSEVCVHPAAKVRLVAIALCAVLVLVLLTQLGGARPLGTSGWRSLVLLDLEPSREVSR